MFGFFFIYFSELGQKKVYSVYFFFQILFLCIGMLGTSGKIFSCSKFSIPLNLSWKAVTFFGVL